MEIISITTLDALNLALFPPHIAIYPPRHVLHGFDLDLELNLNYVPRMYLDCCLGRLLFLPILRFSDVLVFPTMLLIILCSM